MFIISPADGAVVPLTFDVRFGIANMTVVKAGDNAPNSGHHHLLIDAPLPPLDQPIPSDENHLHFGAGQTEATVTLTPGTHTLQLLLGDGGHVPHDPPVFSTPITVIAKAAARRSCRAGEFLSATGVCEPREAGRPVVRKRAAPERAVGKRARPGREEVGSPPAAPQGNFGFQDRQTCPPGFHSIPFPSSSGYRCIPNQ